MFMFRKIRGKFTGNTSDYGSFHGQGYYIIKWNFQRLFTSKTY